jgi:hypothetical protein
MEGVERPPFGKENKDLSKQELKYQEQDKAFKLQMINDEYIK